MAATDLPLNVANFPAAFPYFQAVREVGHFSLDADRVFHDDDRSLSRYAAPALGCSLSDGYPARFVCIPEDEQKREHLDTLLRWVSRHPRFVVANEHRPAEPPQPVGFVCWRGLLTKVMCAPYSQSNELRVSVTKRNGTIYMAEFETANDRQRRHAQTEREKLMCYWGHRFEGYATKKREAEGAGEEGRPAKMARTEPEQEKEAVHEVITNTNVAYCAVFRTRLERHSLLIGAEVDCVSNGKYVELKTTQLITHPRQEASFQRHKLLKWWAQSFLAGIDRIVCGMRDGDGIVRAVEEMSVAKMPALVKDKQMWANVAEESVYYVIDFLPPFTRFTFRPDTTGEFRFLPDWYVAPPGPAAAAPK